MRRYLAWAAVAACTLALLLPVVGSSSPARAASTFGFNWPGGMTAPVMWSGQGSGSTWDVQISKRSAGDSMDPMAAGHGADCAPPPASHPISTLAEGVYICRNHMMTAMSDAGYGVIALTPDHMVDFSSGTAAITFNVSSLQLNLSDWIEVWISPFNDNLVTPSDFGSQGPPAHSLRFSLSRAGILGSATGDVVRSDNFVRAVLPHTGAPALASLVPPSATTRSTFEIDISSSHVRFGLPGVGAGGAWWVDTNISPLGWSQGIVQLTHHSYNPVKHCGSCGVDTWHWSNFSIDKSVPFTILPGTERSVNPAGGATTVHFPAPAPANSALRFSGLGPQGTTYNLSYDGGATWVSPSLQQQIGNHSEIFSSYWTAVPAGTQTVMFRGNRWWGGDWWVRDPAIWSNGQPPGAGNGSPGTGGGTGSGTGTGTGTGGTGTGTGTGGTGTGTGGTGTGGTGTGTGSGEGSKGSGGGKPTGGGTTGGGTTGGGTTGGGTTGGGTTGGGSTGGGSTGGGSGSKESGSGGHKAAPGAAPAPAAAPKSLLIQLAAVLNPRQDPTVNVILLLLAAGLMFAVYRIIRG